MKQIPPIKAVMTAFPHSVASEAPVRRALEMMAEHGIHHLPVVEGERLVGVITDRDIRLAASAGTRGRDLIVADVETREAYVIELTEPLDVVALHMAERRIDAALVVKQGRLAGIFTLTDACRCLGQILRTLFPRGQGDDAA